MGLEQEWDLINMHILLIWPKYGTVVGHLQATRPQCNLATCSTQRAMAVPPFETPALPVCAPRSLRVRVFILLAEQQTAPLQGIFINSLKEIC